MSLYRQSTSRQPAKLRLVTGLPLPAVDMNVPVRIEDFAPNSQWPPTRVAPKVSRLETYEKLYRGDISDFVDDITAANLVPNFFERIPTVIMALVLSSDPAVAPEDLLQVQDVLGSALHNAMRTGRAYMVNCDGRLWSPESASVYEGDEDDIYVMQLLSLIHI